MTQVTNQYYCTHYSGYDRPWSYVSYCYRKGKTTASHQGHTCKGMRVL